MLTPSHRIIVDSRIHHTDYERAVSQICDWALGSESRAVFAASVNNVMEAYDSVEFRRVSNSADLTTPDGMPLVWGLRLLGFRSATRVYGPDLTEKTLARAEELGIPVGFYGGSPESLGLLLDRVRERWPRLQVAYYWAPPFRPLTEVEDAAITRAVQSSGARILFVGLGCPAQEKWIAAHRGVVPCVMLGVGAAFDFLAGTKRQAPRWMMPLGLEWLFRLCTEPRRLWKRYCKHVPRFVFLFGMQLLGIRKPRVAA